MKMYKSVVGLILLTFLAGCTSDWDPGRRNSQAARQTAEFTGAAKHAGRAEPAPRAGAFASLPDRGELLAYDRSRIARQRGAYTSHPIRLSEEHAFRASQAGGELVVTAPNGEQIRLGYERHVEHPDGNWTWIGRTADGADAVLTFGEKAVFGTIPYRDQEPLRVTTRSGGAWLVATDRNKLPRDINRATTRSGGKPDYLVPPSLSASLASSASAIGMAAAQDVSTAAVSNTVDVVLGYTNGFAAANGGTSGAVTRLNNLVEIGNQALANSLVSRRLRLVRTVQVTYADATNNVTTLEELTGYRDGNTIPVPAALQPLRTARDQYGGDLVALVRDFRAPENDGCGIAWLIGGGQTSFTTASAPFGYSVVSDGTDEDESNGNNYFCREESLVHELGHNMGQAHNEDNSDQSGVHPYSYGYRETSTTGFFTVMAYAIEDSSQSAIRHFANPAVTFANRPTGITNASDNTRSLNLTMPVTVNFRAAVVLGGFTKNDIDGDGRSDLIFHNASTRQLSYRIMSGTTTVRSALISGVGAGYTVGATGDVNADGKVDLIWTSAARDLYLWAGNGTGFTSFRIGSYPSGWALIGAGDVDGDGRSGDLLFHNATTRQFSYRIMQGTSTVRSALISGVGAGYTVGATGDFNGDGKVDLIWTSAARDLYMWAGNGTGFTSLNIGGYPAGWALSGAGDIDGNGKSDLFFRNPTTREFSYRIMNGASVVRSALITNTGAGYRIATWGDLNGDAKLDIVWTSNALDLFLWTGNGNTFSGAAIGTYPSGWTVIR